MSAKDDLIDFTRAALGAGHSRDDIGKTLMTAGWSQGEADEALSAWADTPFALPVPRPRSVVTARDFFVYALTFCALISATYCLIHILMTTVDWALDDDFSQWELRGLRSALAGLIVTGPIYGWLTWREETRVARDPGAQRSAIRKWMVYLLLLLTSGILIGDLIWLLGRFLNGDLTLIFILKSGVVGLITGGIFLFYSDIVRRSEAAPARTKGDVA